MAKIKASPFTHWTKKEVEDKSTSIYELIKSVIINPVTIEVSYTEPRKFKKNILKIDKELFNETEIKNVFQDVTIKAIPDLFSEIAPLVYLTIY